MFFQADPEGDAASSGFSVLGMLKNMGWIDLVVVGILFIMSIWSLAVMIDRALYFSAARKQSREFAPKVAGALKDGRLDEAIKVADRSKEVASCRSGHGGPAGVPLLRCGWSHHL